MIIRPAYRRALFAFYLMTLCFGAAAQAFLDAGLVNLEPPKAFAPGTYPIAITVYNNSDTAFLRELRLRWEVNGVAQPELQWTGALALQKDTVLRLGEVSFLFEPDYEIRVSIASVNGRSDDDAGNDSVVTAGIRASYSGILYVGGANPDFNNATELAAALNRRGLAGPVEVRLRPGRYEEAVTFNEVPYAAIDKPIVFRPDPNVPGEVTLASSQALPAWSFYGNTAHLVFKQLRFESGPLPEQHGLYAVLMTPIFTDSFRLTIDSCRFAGTALQGVNNAGLLIQTTGGMDRISVQHCQFSNLSLPASIRAADGDFVFSHNRGGNCGAPWLAFYRATASVSNNVFMAGPQLSNAHPLLIEGNDLEGEVYNNQILSNGTRIASFSHIQQNGVARLQVYNNFFYNISGKKGHGVLLDGGGLFFYFNSIHSHSGLALDGKLSPPYAVYNNIVAEYGNGGTAFRLQNSLEARVDYNAYWSASGPVFNFGGITAISTLDAWQNKIKQDSHSVVTEPGFYLPAHYAAKRAALNGAGTPIAGVTTDIEGQQRDPLHPDLGAVEFTPYLLDAAVTTLVGPVFPFAKGLQPVRVRVRNDATAPIDQISLQTNINGISLPTFTWTGLLAPDSTVVVTTGSFDFQDFTAYRIEVVVQTANTLPEFYTYNDTLRSAPLYTALSGTYEVGIGQFLADPQAGAAALKAYGIASEVRFRLRPGDYGGFLVLDSLRGNPVAVHFESASGQAGDVRYLVDGDTGIWLPGADRYHFRNLTFINRSAHATACLWLTGYVEDVVLDSCIFDLGYADEANAREALRAANPQFSTPPSWLASNIQVRHCRFSGGRSGLLFNPRYVKGITVADNVFEEQSSLGVQVAGAPWPGSGISLIQHNRFESVDSSRFFNGASVAISAGVYSMDTTASGVLIAHNIIRHNKGSAIAVVAPISGLIPLYSNSVVANNFIYTNPEDKGDAAPLVSSLGISGSNVKLYYNTLRTSSAKPCIRFTDIDRMVIRNNLFVRENPAGVMFQGISPGALDADYNNYYSQGLVLFSPRFLGFYANWDYWRSAFQKDAHSLQANPKFTLPGDYHIEQDSLNGKAIPIPGISTDLDGDLRDAQRPDIGADEFKPFLLDVVMLAFSSPAAPASADTYPVKIRLRNRGAVALEHAVIEWSVNGQMQAPVTWTGTLGPDQTAEITLGQWEIAEDEDYSFQATLRSANNGIDDILLNNTADLSHFMTALRGIYRLGTASADFPDFDRAVRALHRRGVSSTVVFKVAAGEYPIAIQLGAIPGAAANRLVRFESDTEDPAVLTFKTTKPILHLLNSRFTHFYGFTFLEPSPPYHGPMVRLEGNCEGPGFDHCIFRSNIPELSTEQASGIFADPLADSIQHLEVLNCRFQSLYAGILIDGAGVLSGIDIQHNRLEACSQYGIHLSGRALSGKVLSNYIYRKKLYAPAASILMRFSTFRAGDFRVESNIMIGTAGYGMQVVLNGGTEKCLILNNFIDLQADGVLDAFDLVLSDSILIAYNTVRISAPQTAWHRVFFAHELRGPVYLYNNIFDNRSWGIACAVEDPGGWLRSDYNCWYGGYDTPFYRNGLFFPNLEAYRSSGLEEHSIFNAPFFPTTGDYHTADAVLNGRALPLPDAPTDLEGEQRHPTAPDIGADESVLVDVSSIASTTVSIYPGIVHEAVWIRSPVQAVRSVAVFDAGGRQIWQQAGGGQHHYSLDAAAWKPGFYTVQVTLEDGGVKVGKVIRAGD